MLVLFLRFKIGNVDQLTYGASAEKNAQFNFNNTKELDAFVFSCMPGFKELTGKTAELSNQQTLPDFSKFPLFKTEKNIPSRFPEGLRYLSKMSFLEAVNPFSHTNL
jgi:hypothetical protein